MEPRMETMRCLKCESVLFLGGDSCPRCGGTDAVPFKGRAGAGRDPAPAQSPAPPPGGATEPLEGQPRATS